MATKRKLPSWMLELSQQPNEKENENCNNELKESNLTFDGQINYCTLVGDCGIACEEIMLCLDKVEELEIGFDLEWPVDFRTGSGRTALIQLCPDEHTCHIFHVSGWERLPRIFIHLIRHPKVRLVGLNIRNDLYKLGRDFDISVKTVLEQNTVDLSEYANKCLHCEQPWSLERLVIHLLKKQLPKIESVRLSNWADMNLSAAQLSYAASDAYASLLVYQHLKKLDKDKEL